MRVLAWPALSVQRRMSQRRPAPPQASGTAYTEHSTLYGALICCVFRRPCPKRTEKMAYYLLCALVGAAQLGRNAATRPRQGSEKEEKKKSVEWPTPRCSSRPREAPGESGVGIEAGRSSSSQARRPLPAKARAPMPRNYGATSRQPGGRTGSRGSYNSRHWPSWGCSASVTQGQPPLPALIPIVPAAKVILRPSAGPQRHLRDLWLFCTSAPHTACLPCRASRRARHTSQTPRPLLIVLLHPRRELSWPYQSRTCARDWSVAPARGHSASEAPPTEYLPR